VNILAAGYDRTGVVLAGFTIQNKAKSNRYLQRGDGPELESGEHR
jgi:hypothetical protein